MIAKLLKEILTAKKKVVDFFDGLAQFQIFALILPEIPEQLNMISMNIQEKQNFMKYYKKTCQSFLVP
jgi:hypothetical protein